MMREYQGMNISLHPFIRELNNKTASVVGVFYDYSVAFQDSPTHARFAESDLHITCGSSFLSLPVSTILSIDRTDCINGHVEYELTTSTDDTVVVDVF